MLTNLSFFNNLEIEASFQLHPGGSENHPDGSCVSPLLADHFPQIVIDHHHPLPKEQWVKLFKKTFRFTGGEIVNEFLMSTGYLPGAHHDRCPVYHTIAALDPPWMQVSE